MPFVWPCFGVGQQQDQADQACQTEFGSVFYLPVSFSDFTTATQRMYIRAIRNFTALLGCTPDRVRTEDLRRYQLHMGSAEGVRDLDERRRLDLALLLWCEPGGRECRG